jgi:hypothetical protein
MPHRVREAACDPLEIGEYPIAPLVMQTVEGDSEELAVIHRKKTWKRNLGPETCGRSGWKSF